MLASTDNALTIETESFTNDRELATIKLPESILNVINDEDDINFGFTIYNQSILFPVQGSVQNTVVESPVIGARIRGVADGTKLPDPVVIRLTLKGTIVSKLKQEKINHLQLIRMQLITSVHIGTLQLQVNQFCQKILYNYIM